MHGYLVQQKPMLTVICLIDHIFSQFIHSIIDLLCFTRRPFHPIIMIFPKI